MAIPDFIDNYHLPPGEHECTLEEAKERFANINEKRTSVWQDFMNMLGRLERLNIPPKKILIDGSFVTGREQPGDVDFACIISPGTIKRAIKNGDEHDKRAITTICNVNNHPHLRDLFGADVLIADNEVTLDLYSKIFRFGKGGKLREPDCTRDPDWVNRPLEKGILKIDIEKQKGDGKNGS